MNRNVESDDDRLSSSLAAVAVVLALVVISLMIVRKLQVRIMLEECAMSGRPACEFAADRLRVSRAFDSVLSDNQ